MLQLFKVLATQLCPALCDLMDCSPPGSSVHGILQEIILEWVGCHSLLQGIFPTQGWNLGLPHCRQILHHLSHQGSLELFKGSCLLSFPVFIITTYSIQKVGRHDTKTLTSIPPPKITTASGEGNGTPTSVLLPGKSHGERSLVGCSPWGR